MKTLHIATVDPKIAGNVDGWQELEGDGRNTSNHLPKNILTSTLDLQTQQKSVEQLKT